MNIELFDNAGLARAFQIMDPGRKALYHVVEVCQIYDPCYVRTLTLPFLDQMDGDATFLLN